MKNILGIIEWQTLKLRLKTTWTNTQHWYHLIANDEIGIHKNMESTSRASLNRKRWHRDSRINENKMKSTSRASLNRKRWNRDSRILEKHEFGIAKSQTLTSRFKNTWRTQRWHHWIANVEIAIIWIYEIYEKLKFGITESETLKSQSNWTMNNIKTHTHTYIRVNKNNHTGEQPRHKC